MPKNFESNKVMVTISLTLTIALILGRIRFKFLPHGGSVTLFSAVPIVILSLKYNFKIGFLCGALYGVLKLLLGLASLIGINILSILFSILFDYILAYGCVGLACIFKKSKFLKGTSYIYCGIVFAMFLRFCSHMISGLFIWSGFIRGTTNIFKFRYCIFYNFCYLFPELLITILGIYIVLKLNRNILSGSV